MKIRVMTAALIGLASGFLCWLMHLQPHAVDFGWALVAAHDVILGQNPYAHSVPNVVPYPLPALGFALPFVFLWKNQNLAGALFFGLSAGILAFGLTRDGFTRLLVFLASPYWIAMVNVQWSPLVMAGALFPLVFPVVLAKPQIGIPVALTNLSRRGVIGCAALTLATLLIMPSWPSRWLSSIGSFQNFIPMLTLPGPLLALALRQRHDPDAQLLLLASFSPQHWFYDSFILWLIPKSRFEILATACASWGAVLFWPADVVAHATFRAALIGSIAVVWMYLPMLAIILLRAKPINLEERQR